MCCVIYKIHLLNKTECSKITYGMVVHMELLMRKGWESWSCST